MKVEGRNGVREAIQNDKISKVMISNNSHDKTINEIVDLCKQYKIKFQFVSNDVLNRESVTKKHQGVIAFTEEFEYCQVEDIISHANNLNEKVFMLILDQIEDPHNLGAIIRICECMGVHGVVIPKNRACQVNETVIRTSAGATTHVKIAKVTNINTTIENLKKQNIWVYACELGGQDLTKSNLSGDIAIVIGSEGKGISSLTKKLCDQIVTIPMYGKINSLNASVATGMVLYEARKNR